MTILDDLGLAEDLKEIQAYHKKKARRRRIIFWIIIIELLVCALVMAYIGISGMFNP